MIFIRNGRLVEAEASGSMVRHGIRYFIYEGEPFTWAVGAFEDRAHFERTRQAVIASRIELVAALAELGFAVLPSAANFIFARHPQRDAAALAAALRERHVIVRHFRLPRIDQFLRITVGSPEQNAALLAALGPILAEG